MTTCLENILRKFYDLSVLSLNMLPGIQRYAFNSMCSVRFNSMLSVEWKY